jgi:hypothetical protein
MTDTPAEAPATGTPAAPENQPAPPAADPPPETKPTETVDFWKAKAREQEKRAKANADAAARLQQIEDAQKTEAQRAAEALTAEKARADAAEKRAAALAIATQHKLGPEDAELLANQPDEDAMKALAERLGKQAEQQDGTPGRVGYAVDHTNTQTQTPPSADDAARQFFGI